MPDPQPTQIPGRTDQMLPDPTSTDPRFQQGAYVTDGCRLYEVRGVRRGQATIGSASAMRVILEDCYDLSPVEFLVDKLRRRFRLVRSAPMASCPDLIKDIAW